jgi:hypothetical protein
MRMSQLVGVVSKNREDVSSIPEMRMSLLVGIIS